MASFDIEIGEKKDNPLLKRTEIRFRILHEGAATPKRDDVREKLAAQMGAKKGLVVVESMTSRFGRGETRGIAKMYKDTETLGKTERAYLLKRNKLEDAAPKKKERTAAPAAAKAPAKKR